MSMQKSISMTSPLLGASLGTAVAGLGMLFSHMAFYIALPIAVALLRVLEMLGIHVTPNFENSCVLLAILSPLVFTCYGTALVVPKSKTARLKIAVSIFLVNAIAVVALLTGAI